MSTLLDWTAVITPEKQRGFALDVVRRLRAAGFEADWAGGCVRDELLHRPPKDYDVATDARPEQIREIFGPKKTLAIGAAFGVITVRGPKAAGMVEVATFRQDAGYADGRHPDHVTFTSAREDALRRDFTINGLFFEPVEGRVIDFVGGQEDLARRVIRAIGPPAERFAEDRLRMLRAVRFSAAFAFPLEAETRAAIGQMAQQVRSVSAERIAMEMGRMLVDAGRVEAVRLLLDTGLAAAVLPEIVPADEEGRKRLDRALAALARLEGPGFALALAALLGEMCDTAAARGVCLCWRLSNKDTARVDWLLKHRTDLADARTKRWSVLQPLLVAGGIEDLLSLHEATAPAGADDGAFCRSRLAQPREALDPPPLLGGDDLLAHGVPAGPKFRVLLQRLRNAQLDGEIRTPAEALALVDQLLLDELPGR